MEGNGKERCFVTLAWRCGGGGNVASEWGGGNGSAFENLKKKYNARRIKSVVD